MEERVYNVLFLSTLNSVRSIMAEAILSMTGKGRFRGFSAGSAPAGEVHRFALDQVAAIGYPAGELRSKSWYEFALSDAPHMDFIITLCDDAAGETCPHWPGHPISAHWGIEDPARHSGSEAQIREQFHKVSGQLSMRIGTFISLPLHLLEKNVIHQEMTAICRTRS